jgi:phosphate transport system substrate-binding protein
MRSLLRWIGLICLIALFANGLFAQEEITIVGSGIAAPIFEAAAETSEVNATINVTGTDRGIESFCQNQADITLATRPFTTDEELNCTTAGVEFLELLAGYNAIAFVSSLDATFNQCLTSDQIRTLLAPSAQGQVNDWSQVNAENPSAPISIIVPNDDTAAYAALDELVEGVGIRGDAQMSSADTDSIADVSANPNALGVVSYISAAAAGESVRTLQLDTGAAGCTTPSLDTIEGREYSGADRLLVYVNSASLSKAGLGDLLSAAVGADARATVEGLGFTAPSDETYSSNQQVIAELQTGRRFSREVGEFNIPEGLFGALTIGGSTVANEYVQGVTAAFTTQQAGVTIEQTYLGEADGFRRLCNGELDIAVGFSDLSAEQADNCAANNVTPHPVGLGSLVVVLVGNANTEFLTCLTTEQLATAWSAASSDTITTWDQVSPDFASTPMTLFAPQPGNPYSDLLMFRVTGSATPSRLDIQLDDDPVYRAAATANVEGALTYMNWTEYEALLASDQANVMSVAVDAGNGCVQPTEDAIADGSYPLVQTVRLIVNRLALARTEVQALLWFIFSDENYNLLTNAGLVGVNFGDLPDIRFELQESFTAAQNEAAAVALERTPEATPEATAERPSEEATSEAVEPTDEATPEATESADEPTEEVTPEATESGN